MAMAEAAGVETESLLIVTEHVTQNANDKREVEPALKALEQLAQPLGKAEALCRVYFDSAAKSYPDIAAVELKSDSLLALL